MDKRIQAARVVPGVTIGFHAGDATVEDVAVYPEVVMMVVRLEGQRRCFVCTPRQWFVVRARTSVASRLEARRARGGVQLTMERRGA